MRLCRITPTQVCSVVEPWAPNRAFLVAERRGSRGGGTGVSSLASPTNNSGVVVAAVVIPMEALTVVMFDGGGGGGGGGMPPIDPFMSRCVGDGLSGGDHGYVVTTTQLHSVGSKQIPLPPRK